MQKTDIGNYSYDANKIHQLKYLTTISNGANPSVVIGTNERNISYTSFLKTATITENNYQLTYTYGSDKQRIKSELKQNGSTIETKLYWGDMELVTKGGVTSEIYYISGQYHRQEKWCYYKIQCIHRSVRQYSCCHRCIGRFGSRTKL